MTLSDKVRTDFDRGTTGDQTPSFDAVAPSPDARIKTAGTRPAATLDVPVVTPPSPQGDAAKPSQAAGRNVGKHRQRQPIWVPAGLALLGLGAAFIAVRR